MGEKIKNPFKELKEVLSVLKSSELEVAKKHLIAYSTNHTLKSSRSLELFKLLLKKPHIDQHKAAKRLKYDSERSFLRLIQRTLSRVEESLILEVNINRPQTYSLLFTTKFKIRKLIMQSQILSARGLVNQSIKLTDQVLKDSKRYELYDEIIEALYNKQVLIGLKKGEHFYKKISKDIDFYENCRMALNNSKDKYRSFYAASDFSGIVKNKTEILSEIIIEIDKDWQITKSVNIKVYYYLLGMELYFLKKEFLKVEKMGLQLIDLLKEELAVFSLPRIGSIYFNLSDTQISAFEFDKAQQYAIKAKECLIINENYNLLMSLEFEYISTFYLGQYEKTIELISELLSLKVTTKFPFKKAKAIYIKTLNFFLLGKFKEAQSLLYNLEEIDKDKEGWNVWIRMMRILCSIEMFRLNMIDYDLESFRKYMIRTSERKDVRSRDKLILKILLDLDKQSYDFKLTAKRRKLELEMLASMEGDLRWEAKSPEMILFHEWFYSKVESRAYKPNFEQYKKVALKENFEEETQHNIKDNFNQLSLDI